MTALLADRADSPDITAVVEAAEQLLTKRMGAPVKLADPVELSGSGRTTVLRVRVSENPFALPRTLVIKQVRAGQTRQTAPAGAPEPGVTSIDSAFLREAVSYQFATALHRDMRPGADLLAHDLRSRLLVLSDLGEGTVLSARLRGLEPAGTANLLMAFAQALGRMHAATVGREEDFSALFQRATDGQAARARREGVFAQANAAVAEVPGLLRDHLGIEVPDDVAELARRCTGLFTKGRFRAFSPSDLCPENVIANERGIRFLDYEWGGFRDATLDIAYALVSFPGCLCDYELSRDRAQQMVDAWRAEVVGVWPQLADDELLARKILHARLMWVWLTTYWFVPGDHVRIASAREHRLSVPRSEALIRRWAGLAEDARMHSEDTLADFADQVTAVLAGEDG